MKRFHNRIPSRKELLNSTLLSSEFIIVENDRPIEKNMVSKEEENVISNTFGEVKYMNV